MLLMAAKIQGSVHVRQANAAEKLVLLNEQEVELNEKVMVIADDEKALAIAGIMGGLSSSVTDETTRHLLGICILCAISHCGSCP